MLHVLVETNWVVGYAAPAHHRADAACKLVERAARGELRVHLPALCIGEARRVLDRDRFRPQNEAKAVREFIRWSLDAAQLAQSDADGARRVVQAMEQKLRRDRAELPDRLAGLRATVGVEVFALTEAMLERSLEIASTGLPLKPFDQAILAAVLARGAELAATGSDVCFVTLDGDLQPWDKHGTGKPLLVDWYDRASVWVYGDFTLTSPERPRG